MRILLFVLILSNSAPIFAQSPVTNTYTGKPRFEILTKSNGDTLGIINVELFPNIAYKHTRNFDSLVSQNFYDTTAFHRVIPNFMIQGGDPNSRNGPKPTWGQGQIGQPTVPAEFTAAKHKRGILSAARSNDINSATSQFFICHAAAPWLDGNYSVYGRVTSGINFVDTIALAPRDNNDCPNDKIEMFVNYIGSNDSVPVAPIQFKPVNDSTEIDTTLITYLSWKHVPDAIIYQVQFSNDSTFAQITYSTNTGNLSYAVTAGLPGNTRYFWRVRTNNGGHFSNWSPVWHFTTQKPFNDVGLQKNLINAHELLLFPNPTKGIFTIKNANELQEIEVYDELGKYIKTFGKDKLSHEIDLRKENKGLYLIKCQYINGSEKTFKLILE
ncbi:MAG: peptidylprolyl isomerase [Sphingobacteriaceae bacterium]|nr:peptidylprolyl isomerase [Sphingobacteriaceae bacterium]